ncbi:hypothetical protein ACFYMW_26185 [Streptomyces sp. NPDC006692]|uniref:hypothetical protein n=1 Tax=unclassified Streptomyces TaxID=2593676 RepID=UPI0034197DE4
MAKFAREAEAAGWSVALRAGTVAAADDESSLGVWECEASGRAHDSRQGGESLAVLSLMWTQEEGRKRWTFDTERSGAELGGRILTGYVALEDYRRALSQARVRQVDPVAEAAATAAREHAERAALEAADAAQRAEYAAGAAEYARQWEQATDQQAKRFGDWVADSGVLWLGDYAPAWRTWSTTEAEAAEAYAAVMAECRAHREVISRLWSVDRMERGHVPHGGALAREAAESATREVGRLMSHSAEAEGTPGAAEMIRREVLPALVSAREAVEAYHAYRSEETRQHSLRAADADQVGPVIAGPDAGRPAYVRADQGDRAPVAEWAALVGLHRVPAVDRDVTKAHTPVPGCCAHCMRSDAPDMWTVEDGRLLCGQCADTVLPSGWIRGAVRTEQGAPVPNAADVVSDPGGVDAWESEGGLQAGGGRPMLICHGKGGGVFPIAFRGPYEGTVRLSRDVRLRTVRGELTAARDRLESAEFIARERAAWSTDMRELDREARRSAGVLGDHVWLGAEHTGDWRTHAYDVALAADRAARNARDAVRALEREESAIVTEQGLAPERIAAAEAHLARLHAGEVQAGRGAWLSEDGEAAMVFTLPWDASHDVEQIPGGVPADQITGYAAFVDVLGDAVAARDERRALTAKDVPGRNRMGGHGPDADLRRAIVNAYKGLDAKPWKAPKVPEAGTPLDVETLATWDSAGDVLAETEAAPGVWLPMAAVSLAEVSMANGWTVAMQRDGGTVAVRVAGTADKRGRPLPYELLAVWVDGVWSEDRSAAWVSGRRVTAKRALLWSAPVKVGRSDTHQEPSLLSTVQHKAEPVTLGVCTPGWSAPAPAGVSDPGGMEGWEGEGGALVDGEMAPVGDPGVDVSATVDDGRSIAAFEVASLTPEAADAVLSSHGWERRGAWDSDNSAPVTPAHDPELRTPAEPTPGPAPAPTTPTAAPAPPNVETTANSGDRSEKSPDKITKGATVAEQSTGGEPAAMSAQVLAGMPRNAGVLFHEAAERGWDVHAERHWTGRAWTRRIVITGLVMVRKGVEEAEHIAVWSEDKGGFMSSASSAGFKEVRSAVAAQMPVSREAEESGRTVWGRDAATWVRELNTAGAKITAGLGDVRDAYNALDGSGPVGRRAVEIAGAAYREAAEAERRASDAVKAARAWLANSNGEDARGCAAWRRLIVLATKCVTDAAETIAGAVDRAECEELAAPVIAEAQEQLNAQEAAWRERLATEGSEPTARGYGSLIHMFEDPARDWAAWFDGYTDYHDVAHAPQGDASLSMVAQYDAWGAEKAARSNGRQVSFPSRYTSASNLASDRQDAAAVAFALAVGEHIVTPDDDDVTPVGRGTRALLADIAAVRRNPEGFATANERKHLAEWVKHPHGDHYRPRAAGLAEHAPELWEAYDTAARAYAGVDHYRNALVWERKYAAERAEKIKQADDEGLDGLTAAREARRLSGREEEAWAAAIERFTTARVRVHEASVLAAGDVEKAEACGERVRESDALAEDVWSAVGFCREAYDDVHRAKRDADHYAESAEIYREAGRLEDYVAECVRVEDAAQRAVSGREETLNLYGCAFDDASRAEEARQTACTADVAGQVAAAVEVIAFHQSPGVVGRIVCQCGAVHEGYFPLRARGLNGEQPSGMADLTDWDIDDALAARGLAASVDRDQWSRGVLVSFENGTAGFATRIPVTMDQPAAEAYEASRVERQQATQAAPLEEGVREDGDDPRAAKEGAPTSLPPQDEAARATERERTASLSGPELVAEQMELANDMVPTEADASAPSGELERQTAAAELAAAGVHTSRDDTPQADAEPDGQAAGDAETDGRGAQLRAALIEGETIAPVTFTDKREPAAGWILTTPGGHTFRLRPVTYSLPEEDEWEAGHDADGSYWWAANIDDRPLNNVLARIREDSATRTRFASLWAQYGHLTAQPPQFETTTDRVQLEEGVLLVRRFGRIGLIAACRWGWEHLTDPDGAQGHTGEDWSRRGPDHRQYVAEWQIWHMAQDAIPNGRLRVVAQLTDDMADTPDAYCDASAPYVGKCSAKRSGARYTVAVVTDQEVELGRYTVCARCLSHRLLNEKDGRIGHRDVQSLVEALAKGDPKLVNLHWEQWPDRIAEVAGQMLSAALDAGEAAPWPAQALTDQIIAEACEAGDDRAKREARAEVKAAGGDAKAQKRAAEEAVAARQDRAALVAGQGAAGRAFSARIRAESARKETVRQIEAGNRAKAEEAAGEASEWASVAIEAAEAAIAAGYEPTEISARADMETANDAARAAVETLGLDGSAAEDSDAAPEPAEEAAPQVVDVDALTVTPQVRNGQPSTYQFTVTGPGLTVGEYEISHDCQGKGARGIIWQAWWHGVEPSGRWDVMSIGSGEGKGAALVAVAEHAAKAGGDLAAGFAAARRMEYDAGLWLLPDVGESESIQYHPDGSWTITAETGVPYTVRREWQGRTASGDLAPLLIEDQAGNLVASCTAVDGYMSAWAPMLERLRLHATAAGDGVSHAVAVTQGGPTQEWVEAWCVCGWTQRTDIAKYADRAPAGEALALAHRQAHHQEMSAADVVAIAELDPEPGPVDKKHPPAEGRDQKGEPLRHAWDQPDDFVTLTMPRPLVDFLHVEETAAMEDPDTRKALVEASPSRNGGLKVTGPIEVHQALLKWAWMLEGGEGLESDPEDARAYRNYAKRIEQAASQLRNRGTERDAAAPSAVAGGQDNGGTATLTSGAPDEVSQLSGARRIQDSKAPSAADDEEIHGENASPVEPEMAAGGSEASGDRTSLQVLEAGEGEVPQNTGETEQLGLFGTDQEDRLKPQAPSSNESRTVHRGTLWPGSLVTFTLDDIDEPQIADRKPPSPLTITGHIFPGYQASLGTNGSAILLDAVVRDSAGDEVAAGDIAVQAMPEQVLLTPAGHRKDLYPELRGITSVRVGDLVAEAGARGAAVAAVAYASHPRGATTFSTRDVVTGAEDNFTRLHSSGLSVVPRERRLPKDVAPLFGEHTSHDTVLEDTQTVLKSYQALQEAVALQWPDEDGPQPELRSLHTAMRRLSPQGRGAEAYRSNAEAMTAARNALVPVFAQAGPVARYQGHIGRPLHELGQQLDIQAQRLSALAAHLEVQAEASGGDDASPVTATDVTQTGTAESPAPEATRAAPALKLDERPKRQKEQGALFDLAQPDAPRPGTAPDNGPEQEETATAHMVADRLPELPPLPTLASLSRQDKEAVRRIRKDYEQIRESLDGIRAGNPPTADAREDLRRVREQLDYIAQRLTRELLGDHEKVNFARAGLLDLGTALDEALQALPDRAPQPQGDGPNGGTLYHPWDLRDGDLVSFQADDGVNNQIAPYYGTFCGASSTFGSRTLVTYEGREWNDDRKQWENRGIRHVVTMPQRGLVEKFTPEQWDAWRRPGQADNGPAAADTSTEATQVPGTPIRQVPPATMGNADGADADDSPNDTEVGTPGPGGDRPNADEGGSTDAGARDGAIRDDGNHSALNPLEAQASEPLVDEDAAAGPRPHPAPNSEDLYPAGITAPVEDSRTPVPLARPADTLLRPGRLLHGDGTPLFLHQSSPGKAASSHPVTAHGAAPPPFGTGEWQVVLDEQGSRMIIHPALISRQDTPRYPGVEDPEETARWEALDRSEAIGEDDAAIHARHVRPGDHLAVTRNIKGQESTEYLEVKAVRTAGPGARVDRELEFTLAGPRGGARKVTHEPTAHVTIKHPTAHPAVAVPADGRPITTRLLRELWAEGPQSRQVHNPSTLQLIADGQFALHQLNDRSWELLPATTATVIWPNEYIYGFDGEPPWPLAGFPDAEQAKEFAERLTTLLCHGGPGTVDFASPAFPASAQTWRAEDGGPLYLALLGERAGFDRSHGRGDSHASTEYLKFESGMRRPQAAIGHQWADQLESRDQVLLEMDDELRPFEIRSRTISASGLVTLVLDTDDTVLLARNMTVPSDTTHPITANGAAYADLQAGWAVPEGAWVELEATDLDPELLNSLEHPRLHEPGSRIRAKLSARDDETYSIRLSQIRLATADQERHPLIEDLVIEQPDILVRLRPFVASAEEPQRLSEAAEGQTAIPDQELASPDTAPEAAGNGHTVVTPADQQAAANDSGAVRPGEDGTTPQAGRPATPRTTTGQQIATPAISSQRPEPDKHRRAQEIADAAAAATLPEQVRDLWEAARSASLPPDTWVDTPDGAKPLLPYLEARGKNLVALAATTDTAPTAEPREPSPDETPPAAGERPEPDGPDTTQADPTQEAALYELARSALSSEDAPTAPTRLTDLDGTTIYHVVSTEPPGGTDPRSGSRWLYLGLTDDTTNPSIPIAVISDSDLSRITAPDFENAVSTWAHLAEPVLVNLYGNAAPASDDSQQEWQDHQVEARILQPYGQRDADDMHPASASGDPDSATARHAAPHHGGTGLSDGPQPAVPATDIPSPTDDGGRVISEPLAREESIPQRQAPVPEVPDRPKPAALRAGTIEPAPQPGPAGTEAPRSGRQSPAEPTPEPPRIEGAFRPEGTNTPADGGAIPEEQNLQASPPTTEDQAGGFLDPSEGHIAALRERFEALAALASGDGVLSSDAPAVQESKPVRQGLSTDLTRARADLDVSVGEINNSPRTTPQIRTELGALIAEIDQTLPQLDRIDASQRATFLNRALDLIVRTAEWLRELAARLQAPAASQRIEELTERLRGSRLQPASSLLAPRGDRRLQIYASTQRLFETQLATPGLPLAQRHALQEEWILNRARWHSRYKIHYGEPPEGLIPDGSRIAGYPTTPARRPEVIRELGDHLRRRATDLAAVPATLAQAELLVTVAAAYEQQSSPNLTPQQAPPTLRSYHAADRPDVCAAARRLADEAASRAARTATSGASLRTDSRAATKLSGQQQTVQPAAAPTGPGRAA